VCLDPRIPSGLLRDTTGPKVGAGQRRRHTDVHDYSRAAVKAVRRGVLCTSACASGWFGARPAVGWPGPPRPSRFTTPPPPPPPRFSGNQRARSDGLIESRDWLVGAAWVCFALFAGAFVIWHRAETQKLAASTSSSATAAQPDNLAGATMSSGEQAAGAGASGSVTPVTAFGSALFANLAVKEKGNVVVSPISVALAMAMAVAGSTPESSTNRELKEVLKYALLGDERAVDAWFAETIPALETADPKVQSSCPQRHRLLWVSAPPLPLSSVLVPRAGHTSAGKRNFCERRGLPPRTCRPLQTRGGSHQSSRSQGAVERVA